MKNNRNHTTKFRKIISVILVITLVLDIVLFNNFVDYFCISDDSYWPVITGLFFGIMDFGGIHKTERNKVSHCPGDRPVGNNRRCRVA